MEKILITPRSFGKTAPEAFEMLRDAGYELVCNDTGSILDKAQMTERIRGCAGVIIGVDPMDADVIAAGDALRGISKYGIGIDNIDQDACRARNIGIARAVGSNSEAVADYAFALILALSRRIVEIDARCRRDDWRKITTTDVGHKTIGIFGLGAIGKLVAKRARGFDMRVLAYDVYWDDRYAAENGIEYARPDQIFRESDFISLHLPLMDSTEGFVGARELGMMKETAYLVNTARGGLIDEAALLFALRSGAIAGAGLDSFVTEPPEDPAWTELDNVILGSHCAASTVGAVSNMSILSAENMIKLLKEE